MTSSPWMGRAGDWYGALKRNPDYSFRASSQNSFNQSVLAALAYHRVGSRVGSEFDPRLFTADADQLSEHIGYMKKHHRLVGLEEALAIVAGRERLRGAAVLLTFDDGYMDSFETAFPVLRAHGVEAVFFVVSGFAAGGRIAWWDRAAWAIRHSKKQQLTLRSSGEERDFCLSAGNVDTAIEDALDFLKASDGVSPEDFVNELETACGVECPAAESRMFLGWSEARQMKTAGMVIGSHTHTHPILSRLSPVEQARELQISRQILEEQLGPGIDVLSYPVGGPRDFTPVTEEILKACGYRAAFSCYGGFNAPRSARRFDIKRIPVYWGARPEWLMEN